MTRARHDAAIPQASPLASYRRRGEEIDAAVRRVLASGRYVLGPEVEAFEAEFAEYLGATSAVGVANGTDALELALRACGIGPGDGVVTVAHTAVATASAIVRAGAVPVFVDVDRVTQTIDPDSVAGLLAEPSLWPQGAKGLKAVIAVHLYGQPADVLALSALCRREGLRLIEDCAQAHGASVEGRRVGTWGDLAAFSFYPTKNLGCLGDGGMVVAQDPQLARTVRSLREYGWRKTRYVSEEPGLNSRLDELQAAILRVLLPHLDEANGRRQRVAARYSREISARELALPASRPRSRHVYHQYVVCCPFRDELRAHLSELSIGTAIHYPVPVHRQPAYKHLAPRRCLETTESLASEVLSLPIYPELTERHIKRVAEAVNEFDWKRRPSISR